ncbi:aminotransferase class I/II [Saccharobesus litoralis]|uniref:cysteine-S-conjugate beta-lyase n=1 Tax=Saccharobesus litoralis TaxID=2172099 RepID=A0A2S0VMB0_9ALTE|nr:PatB family C-S lyase [Saccharobesus litoralis]AWB65354.1 aminotransferase class I/II [Saccharobesus litoralis]
MSFDFDRVIDRKPTHSFKWNKYQGTDILPMWVADTEFSPPQEVLDAICERTQHGPLGYTLPYDSLNQVTVDWIAKQHDWQIKPEWLVWNPGVVPAFNVAAKAFCQAGDKILVQTPNYPPMLKAPELNQCELVKVPSILLEGRYELDLAALDNLAADPKTKLFLFCNPMNPCGSVLTQAELQAIADICAKHNVIICSDEIHCDLVLNKDAQHIPMPTIKGAEDNSFSLMAASKTFNIAGLGVSFSVIPNVKLRNAFRNAAMGIVPWAQILGLVATEAAFEKGHAWHEALLDYLRGNQDYLYKEINAIKGLKMVKSDATFLAWIDCSELGIDNVQKFWEDAGVGPSPGRDFGEPLFARINFGCPRSQLEQAVTRIKNAVTKLLQLPE